MQSSLKTVDHADSGPLGYGRLYFGLKYRVMEEVAVRAFFGLRHVLVETSIYYLCCLLFPPRHRHVCALISVAIVNATQRNKSHPRPTFCTVIYVT